MRKKKPYRIIRRYVSERYHETNGRLQQRAEHRLIAERALGKPLPVTAPVHHFDYNPLNNVNTNLVICEDERYHQLLHVLQRIAAAGGDPHRDYVCRDCKSVKPREAFPRYKRRMLGIWDVCKACCAVRWKNGGNQYARQRHLKKKTHCLRGHPLAGDNLLIFYGKTQTWRRCALCHEADRQRRRRSHG